MEVFKTVLNVVELIFYTAVIIYIVRRWKK